MSYIQTNTAGDVFFIRVQFDMLIKLEAFTTYPPYSHTWFPVLNGTNKVALYHGFRLINQTYRLIVDSYDEAASDAGLNTCNGISMLI